MDDDNNWFHGDISTRTEAEKVLTDYGFEEGLFLVRNSSSSNCGDFALSVVHSNSIIHYQIRRHPLSDQDEKAEEALFSLSVETRVIHGLDELIFYYQRQPKSGLQHKLGRFVPGNPCPTSVRLHGVENLLHRASMAGNTLIVQELLRCGGRDISAKNHDGLAALHLATFYGHIEVVDLLIQYGANVNQANSSGYTSLHVACQSNQIEVLKKLLQSGANPNIQNQMTSWKPLHEASWNGFTECAQVLIKEGNSPLLPRTDKNETPIDIARANGHQELANLLDNWVIEPPISDRHSWLHSDAIGRTEAISLLRQHQEDDGRFLVRKSQKRANTFVLSMMFGKKFGHFEIESQGIYVFLDQGPYMHSLEHLVDHYNQFSDGLPCRLLYPVSPEAPLLPLPPSMCIYAPTTAPRLLARNRICSYPSNLKPVDDRNEYENREVLRRVRHSRDDIPIEAVNILEAIGEGEFGVVYKGLYMNVNGEIKSVAIKRLNAVNPKQAKDFLKEANVMMELDHHCIVHLVGVSHEPPTMILELVPFGSMLDYLKDNSESIRINMEIPLWAAQIARGMMYLVSKQFIHRDLAARNILLASKLQAKISDFGLSTVMSDGKDYYQASQGGRWPIKWYAPESVNYGTFSHKTDVWSFGVTLWEMYTFGCQPYQSMSGVEVIKYLDAGKRLARPTECEQDVWNTMNWCWEYDPKSRPSFSELFKFFVESPEYANLKDLLKSQDLGKMDSKSADMQI